MQKLPDTIDEDHFRNNFNNFFLIVTGERLANGWPCREKYKAQYDRLEILTSHFMKEALSSNNLEAVSQFLLDLAKHGHLCGTGLSEIVQHNWGIVFNRLGELDDEGSLDSQLKCSDRRAFFTFLEEVEKFPTVPDVMEENTHVEEYLRKKLHELGWHPPLNPQRSALQNEFETNIYAEGAGHVDFTPEIVETLFLEMMPLLILDAMEDYQRQSVIERKTEVLGNLIPRSRTCWQTKPARRNPALARPST